MQITTSKGLSFYLSDRDSRRILDGIRSFRINDFENRVVALMAFCPGGFEGSGFNFGIIGIEETAGYDTFVVDGVVIYVLLDDTAIEKISGATLHIKNGRLIPVRIEP